MPESATAEPMNTSGIAATQSLYFLGIQKLAVGVALLAALGVAMAASASEHT